MFKRIFRRPDVPVIATKPVIRNYLLEHNLEPPALWKSPQNAHYGREGNKIIVEYILDKIHRENESL